MCVYDGTFHSLSTTPTVQSSSSAANSRSAGCRLRDPNVQYRVYKSVQTCWPTEPLLVQWNFVLNRKAKCSTSASTVKKV